MLSEISAKNFKTWRELGPIGLAPLTGFFGANSSGKSSILQLLLLLKQTVESSDRAAVLEFGHDKSLTNLGSFRDVVYGHRTPGILEFSLDYTLPEPLVVTDPVSKGRTLFEGTGMGFRSRLSANGAGKLSVDEIVHRLEDHTFRMRKKPQSPSKYELDCNSSGFKFVRSVGRAWDLPPPVKCYGFPDQVYAYFQNAGFLADLQLAFEEMLQKVFYLGPLRDSPQPHYTWTGSEPADMGRRGERVVDAILASRERGQYISPGHRRKRRTLEERVAQWLKDLGLIAEFKVEAIAEGSKLYQVRVRQSQGSPPVRITDVGFGVSQVLPVLVLCYYAPEGSTLLLEQPELHLHPSVQSGLADVFIDVMKNRRMQIIIESHSEHLLNRIQRRVAEQCIDPEQTAFYFCQSTKDGGSATKLDVDLYGSILNWPTDFFGDEFGEMAAITEAAMRRREAAGE